jgi:hypothetical protein
VGESYLGARLGALRRAQNPDGGWGYFAGKQSWLEPTFYAALALDGDPASDRAWTLLKSWQQPDGGWHPSKDVLVPHWDTALCVTLATVRRDFTDPFRRGVDWLLNIAGSETDLLHRAAAKVGLFNAERNLSFKGWPWKPGTTSWVEPTAHTLVALKKAASKISSADLNDRVRLGEAQLLDIRCRDAGWNYGSREALGVDLPSYPETTALALLGLQGRPGLGNSLDTARRMAAETKSPMASAWLTIALRLHGASIPAPLANEPSADLMITGVEALSAEDGNYKFLRTGGNG